MKNELNKQIKILFQDEFNPNLSMGRIITLFNNDEVVAHLSLTWPTKLWFSYHNDGKFDEFYFPYYFNDYSSDDYSIIINFKLNGKKLIIGQNNLYRIFELEKEIEFNRYEIMKNFENSTIETIENNQYSVKYKKEDIKIKKRTTDIIITSYKDIDVLKYMLDSIFLTYKKNKYININNFIICDNNNDIENSLKLNNLLNNYKFKFKYFKNKDNSYVSNRVSGIKQALNFCQSDLVTIIDSDIIFINDNWIDSYNIYNQIPDILGSAFIADQTGSHYFRDSQLILPRFHTCFFHCNTEYLKQQIEKDPDILNDFKLSFKFGNLKLNAMGLHFSKLYATARSQMDEFFVFNQNELVNLDRLNNMSIDNFKDIICIHIENMSFREVWKNNIYIQQKYNKIINSLSRLLEFNNSEILKQIIKDVQNYDL